MSTRRRAVPSKNVVRRSSYATRRAFLEQLEDRSLLAVGDLETSFGVGGSTTTDFTNLHDYARAMAVQSDGRIVVVGTSHNGSDNDFAIARYNPDGTADLTFGSAGKLTTDLGPEDGANAVALQTDGKIVVAGYSGSDFAIARYNFDGSLDANFDLDGSRILSLGSATDIIYSLAIQADGKIVVAGVSNNGSGDDFALARLNSNGSSDNTFDGDGILTFAIGTSNDVARAVAIQSDGRIVVAGHASNGTDSDFAIARLLINGQLDTSFDLDGKRTLIFGSAPQVFTSLVGVHTAQPFLQVGTIPGIAGQQIAISRVGIGGDSDSGSGDNLFRATGGGIDFTWAAGQGGSSPEYRLSPTPVISGSARGFSYANTTSEPFAANGSSVAINWEFKFDYDGRYTFATDLFGNAYNDSAFPSSIRPWVQYSYVPNGGNLEDIATALVIQPDGKLVVGGYSSNDFAIARFHSDGSLDLTFDSDGKVKTDFTANSIDNLYSLELQSDGKIIAVGFSSAGTALTALARYNSDGSLDTTFNSDGKVTHALGMSASSAFDVVIDTDGGILTAGVADFGNSDFSVTRYVGDGVDFGDAPTSYDVGIDGPARHLAVGPRLGDLRDAELEAYPTSDASGDDSHLTDDEDGLASPNSQLLVVPGASHTITVRVTNITESSELYGWIDFNHSGTFDESEKAYADVVTGSPDVQLTFANVPSGFQGVTAARFRIASDGAAIPSPQGLQNDGEVEDYRAFETQTLSNQLAGLNAYLGSLHGRYGALTGSLTPYQRSFGEPLLSSVESQLVSATSFLASLDSRIEQATPDVWGDIAGDLMGAAPILGSIEGQLRDLEFFYINRAPSNLGLSPSSLPENSLANTVVGMFSSTDENVWDTFTYSLVTGAGSNDNGNFTISGNQLLANVPFNFEGPNSFHIRVKTTDAGGLPFEKELTITVTDVNEPPVAELSSVTTSEDSARIFASEDFLFTDPEDDSLVSITITSIALLEGDTLQLNGFDVPVNESILAAEIPNLVYTPALDRNGSSTSFEFRVNDADNLGTVSATMTINVTPVNDPPEAVDDSLPENTEDNVRTISFAELLENDKDVDNPAEDLTITAVGAAVGGSVEIVGSNVIFTPTLNFTGTASFEYTLSDGDKTDTGLMTFGTFSVNDAPVAEDDSFAASGGNDSFAPSLEEVPRSFSFADRRL